jgi:CBS domain-containing protein
MTQNRHNLRDLMTPSPVILDAATTVAEAARHMRDQDVGGVLVASQGELRGIVTDRDIVVRCIAASGQPDTDKLGDLCSEELLTLDADASVDDAVDLMRRCAVRRVPVMDGGSPLGIVSLGDLAIARDPNSVLGQISAAPSTR